MAGARVEMNSQRRFPIPYDYFKSIVALFLLLLILLAWRSSGPPPTLSVAVEPDGSVTFSGAAKRGRLVAVSVTDGKGGKSKLKVSADDAGNWLASKHYPPGSYTATASAAGKQSSQVAFRVPTSASLEKIAIRSKENMVAGTASPNQTLLVIVDGALVGKIKTAADGRWSFSYNGEAGDHTVQVAYAAAPKIVSQQVMVEIKPVTVVPLASIRKTSYENGKLTIQGNAPTGAQRVFVWVDGVLLGSATPDADGNWRFSADPSPGKHQVWVSLKENGDLSGTHSEIEVPERTREQTQPQGLAYVVKEGDWLSKLAQQYLGSTSRYAEIRRATNAKAALDPSFATIEDDNLIYPGEKIWIPAR